MYTEFEVERRREKTKTPKKVRKVRRKRKKTPMKIKKKSNT